MPPNNKHITHVVFDMDGLLLDTEIFYTQAQQKVLDQFGKQFTWDLKAKQMGKKALESAQVGTYLQQNVSDCTAAALYDAAAALPLPLTTLGLQTNHA